MKEERCEIDGAIIELETTLEAAQKSTANARAVETQWDLA
jgi:hypothetical protein